MVRALAAIGEGKVVAALFVSCCKSFLVSICEAFLI